jgi:hypothetical protein
LRAARRLRLGFLLVGFGFEPLRGLIGPRLVKPNVLVFCHSM